MPTKLHQPKSCLLKLVAEARMKPDLRRFSLLQTVAAELPGFPDWATGFNHVRLLDRVGHRSLSLTSQDVRYIQEGDSRASVEPRAGSVPLDLFDKLEVVGLQRMGHRRWYLIPLEMAFDQAVDLFNLRYYSHRDPLAAAGHRIRDVLYRVDSSDGDGWGWHIQFAPVPKAQLLRLLEYDFEGHWTPEQAREAMVQLQQGLPEVGLYQDLDCYRDETDIPVGQWEPFLVQAGEKMESLSTALFSSFFDRGSA